MDLYTAPTEVQESNSCRNGAQAPVANRRREAERRRHLEFQFVKWSVGMK